LVQAEREIAEPVEVQFFPPLPQPEAVQAEGLIVLATVKTELAAVLAVAEQHIIGYPLVPPLPYLVKEPEARELLAKGLLAEMETSTTQEAVVVVALVRLEIQMDPAKAVTGFHRQ
jgi:hypothetical protein